MSDMPNYVKNCVTHHYGCDCREWKFRRLEDQLEKAEKVIEEIRDFENNDHLDVVGCELQGIAREYFKDKELEK